MSKLRRWIWLGLAAALAAVGAAFLWNRQSVQVEAVAPRTILPGHTGYVRSLAFLSDGKMLVSAGGEERAVRLWDVRTGRLLHTAGVAGAFAAVSPIDDTIALGAAGNSVYLWNAETGDWRPLESSHQDSDPVIAFSPDGRTVAAIASLWISIWNVETGEKIQTAKGSSFMYSPDSKRIVTAGIDATAEVWDLNTGALALTLRGHSGMVHLAAFSPDSKRIVSASFDKTVKIWDADTGNEIRTLQGHRREVWVAEFSPDGKRISSISVDENAYIWDADTGAKLKTLKNINRYLSHMFLEGEALIQSAPRALTIWDAARGQRLHTLSYPLDYVYPIASSPDGKMIAAADLNGEIFIWDIEEAPTP